MPARAKEVFFFKAKLQTLEFFTETTIMQKSSLRYASCREKSIVEGFGSYGPTSNWVTLCVMCGGVLYVGGSFQVMAVVVGNPGIRSGN